MWSENKGKKVFFAASSPLTFSSITSTPSLSFIIVPWQRSCFVSWFSSTNHQSAACFISCFCSTQSHGRLHLYLAFLLPWPYNKFLVDCIPPFDPERDHHNLHPFLSLASTHSSPSNDDSWSLNFDFILCLLALKNPIFYHHLLKFLHRVLQNFSS